MDALKWYGLGQSDRIRSGAGPEQIGTSRGADLVGLDYFWARRWLVADAVFSSEDLGISWRFEWVGGLQDVGLRFPPGLLNLKTNAFLSQVRGTQVQSSSTSHHVFITSPVVRWCWSKCSPFRLARCRSQYFWHSGLSGAAQGELLKIEHLETSWSQASSLSDLLPSDHLPGHLPVLSDGFRRFRGPQSALSEPCRQNVAHAARKGSRLGRPRVHR